MHKRQSDSALQGSEAVAVKDALKDADEESQLVHPVRKLVDAVANLFNEAWSLFNRVQRCMDGVLNVR